MRAVGGRSYIHDLVTMAGGAPLRGVLAEVAETATGLADDEQLAGAAAQLDLAREAFEGALVSLGGHEDAALLTGLNAVPLTDLFGALASAPSKYRKK